MSIRLPLRPVALCTLLASAAVAVAWNRPVTAAATPMTLAAGEEEELEEVMEGLDKNFEAALAAIEKKDGPAAIELAGKMQMAAMAAKTMTPPKLRIIEEKDKAAFVAGYRKGVLSLLKATADFEIALIDNDFDKAKKLAEEMDAVKKSSHEVYKKMPRKGGAGGEKGEKGK